MQGAWLPRPYALIAEEKGFVRLNEWSDIIDDPLPITMETTTSLWTERADDSLVSSKHIAKASGICAIIAMRR